jgi:MOSC domain-containing protein YiiM
MIIIQSINVALPTQINISNDKSMRSAIHKKPVVGMIYIDEKGLLGDGFADKVHHGGADKAVCVYSLDHFSFWEKELGRQISPGAFGENFSISNLDESDVHIGDIFRIGEVEVQVTQPRQPCHKLNKVFRYQAMACKVKTTGYSGFYMRVLKSGWVEPRMKMELVHADSGKFSIESAHYLLLNNKHEHETIQHILAVEALSDSWRSKFRKRLVNPKATNSLDQMGE